MATLPPMRCNGGFTPTALIPWTYTSPNWAAGGATAFSPGWQNASFDTTLSNGDEAYGQVAGPNTTTTTSVPVGPTPADFLSMLTMAIRIRTFEIGAYVDDTGRLEVSVKTSGGTVLAGNNVGGAAQLHRSVGTSWSTSTVDGITAVVCPTADSTVALVLSAAGLSATKADWDDALVEFTFVDSRSMGTDSAAIILDDFELTGTYTPLARPTIRQDRFPRRMGSRITRNHW